MLKETLAAFGCAGMLATAGAFAAGDTTPSCCHKGKQAADQSAQKMRCSLTGNRRHLLLRAATGQAALHPRRQGRRDVLLQARGRQGGEEDQLIEAPGTRRALLVVNPIKSPFARPLQVTSLGAAALGPLVLHPSGARIGR